MDANEDQGKRDVLRELDAAHEEIRRLRKIIEEKDLEVSFVVHDLKNPLSTIEMNFSLISGILGEHEELSKLSRISDLISSQITSMKHLINELLNISKMENAKLSLNAHEVKVSRFLKSVLDENSATVENNGMKLRLSVNDDIGVLSLDEHLMRRVFANLIVNAIKYSLDSEEIVLHAQTSGNNEAVRFSVEDFGIGVPEEYRETVFNKFERGNAKDSKERPSHGLGLYFCKLVIELHGGRIWVEGGERKGSRFIFELPREKQGSGS